MLAYILGNGPSRKELDLDTLKSNGTVYGCNALYRDWSPNYIVANDWPVMVEIILSDYKVKCIFTDIGSDFEEKTWHLF